MKQITLKARAKINWTLDITGKRADGYHLMDMLLQSISVYDRVKVKIKNSPGIDLGGTPFLARMGSKNIAYKAAESFYSHINTTPACIIEINKSIPVCAGMGGGSSDCAAVLLALNRLYQTNLPHEELAALALSLGADVPFMLTGGLARAQGIGEELTFIDLPWEYHCVGIMPRFGVSTKEVFSRFDINSMGPRPDNSTAITALKTHDLMLLKGCMKNVLQPVTQKLHPQLALIEQQLQKQGAISSVMSGSGTFIYGLFQDRQAAAMARDNLIKLNLGRVIAFKTEKEAITVIDEK